MDAMAMAMAMTLSNGASVLSYIFDAVRFLSPTVCASAARRRSRYRRRIIVNGFGIMALR